MEPNVDPEDHGLDAFFARYEADVAAGGARRLEEYQAMFPAAAAAIAGIWSELLATIAPDPGLHRLSSLALRDAPGPEASPAWRVGPYRIVRLLGAGGMGEVWLAEEDHPRRPIALKVLPRERLTPEAARRFELEAELLGRLRHPGIARVHAAGREPATGMAWIAMQYIEGEPLSRRLGEAEQTLAEPGATGPGTGRTRFDPEGAVRIVERVARALHSAHEAGVIHRDVKPGNIILTADAEPVLVDFGIARDTAGDLDGLTRTGQMPGTPFYMSPEQISGPASAVDRRTDVWSLGVTLYEMVCGRRPFQGPTRDALHREILTQEPPAPGRFRPDLPRDLDAVMAMALAKETDRRYATALAFAGDLRSVIEHRPVSARRVGPLGRAWRWARRHRTVAALLITLFLALSAGLATSLAFHAAADRERKAAAAGARIAFASLDTLARRAREDLTDLPGEGVRRARGRLLEAALSGLDALESAVETAPFALGDLRVDALWNLAATEEALGRVAAAAKRLETAVRICREAAREARDGSPAAVRLARALFQAGWNLDLQGRGAEGLPRFLEAFDRLGPPGGPSDDAPLRADLHAHAGELLRMHGSGADALRHLDQAVAMARAALASDPESREHRGRLGRILEWRANARLGVTGSLDGMTDLEECAAIFERLVEEAPRSVQLRRHWAATLQKLGEWRRSLGQGPLAAESLARSLAVRRELRAEDPDHGEIAEELATSLARSSDLAADGGGPEPALPFLDEAVAALRTVVAAGPDVPSSSRVLLGNLLARRALRLREAGRPADGVADSTAARDLLESLVAAHPGDPEARLALVPALQRHAEILAVLERPDEAVAAAESAVEQARILWDLPGKDVLVRFHLPNALLTLGEILKGAGKVPETGAAAARMLANAASWFEAQPASAETWKRLDALLGRAESVLAVADLPTRSRILRARRRAQERAADLLPDVASDGGPDPRIAACESRIAADPDVSVAEADDPIVLLACAAKSAAAGDHASAVAAWERAFAAEDIAPLLVADDFAAAASAASGGDGRGSSRAARATEWLERASRIVETRLALVDEALRGNPAPDRKSHLERRRRALAATLDDLRRRLALQAGTGDPGAVR